VTITTKRHRPSNRAYQPYFCAPTCTAALTPLGGVSREKSSASIFEKENGTVTVKAVFGSWKQTDSLKTTDGSFPQYRSPWMCSKLTIFIQKNGWSRLSYGRACQFITMVPTDSKRGDNSKIGSTRTILQTFELTLFYRFALRTYSIVRLRMNVVKCSQR